MKLAKDKYIIVELIPTTLKKETGDIIQLSALKIENLQITGRFDYRLHEDRILIKDFLDIISYDKEAFTYKYSTEEIIECFKEFIKDYPLLIIDNEYTRNYLSDITNKKESLYDYFDIEHKDSIIEELMSKYNIEPTNYIVDIIYESIIKII
jgi:DNA polymerase III alpha subunit (gram-positive type)